MAARDLHYSRRTGYPKLVVELTNGIKAKFANSQPADVKTKSIEALRQVSAVLAAKAPGDAAAFKSWLRQVSQGTAEAASEGGGLFGLGGVQVSEAEKGTLAEISNALGV